MQSQLWLCNRTSSLPFVGLLRGDGCFIELGGCRMLVLDHCRKPQDKAFRFTSQYTCIPTVTYGHEMDTKVLCSRAASVKQRMFRVW